MAAASSAQPCVACGLPTRVGAIVGTVTTQRPLCGKPCAYVRIGVDINDLATAQRGLDAASAERIAVLAEIDQVTAALAENSRTVALRRGVVLAQNERYKQWVREQFGELHAYDAKTGQLTKQLEALHARESEIETRMQALTDEIEKIRRLLTRAAHDDDAEPTRAARVRYAGPAAVAREPARPLMEQFTRDATWAPPAPRRGIFAPTWGDTELSSSSSAAAAARTPSYMEM